MKRTITLSVLIVLSAPLFSQSVTWKDVAPIFYNNCTACHRPGEIGDGYINATGYSNLLNSPSLIAITDKINNKEMPPWPADPSYRHFIGERALEQSEIDLINQWMDDGAPAGDTTLAPPAPVFPTGSQLGIPDFMLNMAAPFQVAGNSEDVTMVFVMPTNYATDVKLSGIEFRPGNGVAVHHAFIWFDESGQAAQEDAQTPEYGFPSFGQPGTNAAEFMTLYGPGLQPRLFPPNMAMTLPAGADILLQIHYAPLDFVTTDSSSINFFISSDVDPREVKNRMFGENALQPPGTDLFIPADSTPTFLEQASPNWGDISLISIAPHMHMIGSSFKIFAVNPFNDTIPIIYIPNWDFSWQLLYNLEWLQKLEDATSYNAIASYDNTDSNEFNPNNPPIDVEYGTGSEDEMMKYFILYADYLPGDELIVLDSSLITGPPPGLTGQPQFYPIYPNPSSDFVHISYYLPESTVTRIYIYDVLGKLMNFFDNGIQVGLNRMNFKTANLANGVYFCRLQAGEFTIAKEFVLQR